MKIFKYYLMFVIICVIGSCKGAAIDDMETTIILQNIKYLIWDKSKLNWQDAVDFCKNRSMTLVSFDSLKEVELLNDFLESQDFVDRPKIGNNYIYWISANDLKEEGTFVWESTGKPLNFTNWLPKMPDNWRDAENCVEMGFRELGKWNDTQCQYLRHFICKEKIKTGEASE